MEHFFTLVWSFLLCIKATVIATAFIMGFKTVVVVLLLIIIYNNNKIIVIIVII